MECYFNKRNQFIDIIKGCAILLVLLGHSIQYSSQGTFDFFNNQLFKFIYTFHMPLFMLVSGYLFYFTQQKRTLNDLIQNRLNGLVHPIVGGGIVHYYVIAFVAAIMNRSFWRLLSAGWINSLSGLWFLWSITASSLITGLVYKFVKKQHVRFVLLLIFFPLVYLFPNGDNSAFMYPYFVLGFLFCQYKENIPSKVLLIKYISLIIFPIMLSFYEKKHYIYTSGIMPFRSEYGLYGQIQIDLFRYLIGFLGSIMIICIIELILKVKWLNMLHMRIALLGRYSLQIYVLQRTLLETLFSNLYGKIVNHLGYNILTNNMILYSFVYIPLIAICFAAGIMEIIKIMEKLKISKLVFGR